MLLNFVGFECFNSFGVGFFFNSDMFDFSDSEGVHFGELPNMSVGLNIEPLTDGEVVEVVLAVINDSKEKLEYVGFDGVREVEGELGSGSNNGRVLEDGTEVG